MIVLFYLQWMNLNRLKNGDYREGGIIFWLDGTNLHGLVYGNVDQTSCMIGAIWGCESDYIATSNDIG